ncbi:TetR/AcrR family transcriptional regulator [Alkalihalobacterium chitinilyticum]|uniref:TetR/AcrR family transcriptional regulator n=1 Tax=Alkalihalobacterium chitinilyticum TaxID=2980103 RepID=A0ABT5VKT9_9BACI|nr:TetR/AcrR family transcriptional regulator [Alkalihalobacterium chitinilyticum]MDE5415063.1 TetR/AcrR family transcriptional regulator [Alkalihalobacterium chitinilyticum]
MSESTKKRIIDSALMLFKEKGFHEVSVRMIAKEAGVSNGGFYHHFQTKDELLYQINDFILTYVMETGKAAAVERENPVEKLEGMIRAFILAFDVYNLEISVMYRENHYLAPEYFEKIKQKRDEYQDYIFTILEEGIKAGEIRSNTPLLLNGMAMFGMINWTYQWYEKNRSISIDQIADVYIDFIMNALLTKKAKQSPRYQEYFLDDE